MAKRKSTAHYVDNKVFKPSKGNSSEHLKQLESFKGEDVNAS